MFVFHLFIFMKHLQIKSRHKLKIQNFETSFYIHCSKSISIPPNHLAAKLYSIAPTAPAINPNAANKTGIPMSAKNASAVPPFNPIVNRS